MHLSLKKISLGLSLLTLVGCSQGVAPNLSRATLRAQSNTVKKQTPLLKGPAGQLRKYKLQAQQSEKALLAAMSVSPANDFSTQPVGVPTAPELVTEPPPALTFPNSPFDPPSPPSGIDNPAQPTNPNAPSEPSNPNAPTQPNNPNAPSGGFRYDAQQWHLRKTNTHHAWRFTQGNPEMTVAVIDSGIDYHHPSFRGRVLKGFDFAGNDPDPMDEMAHGTHVSGIIAGNDGNIRGIAPNVKILAIKVFSPSGFAQGEYVLANAVRYAVQHGASVINLSLGSPTLYDCGEYAGFIRALNSAIDEAYASGVNVVTAAGNEGYDFIYGRCSVQQNVNQIPVVATNELDRLASFSNHPNFSHPKAISAPGVNIFSSIPLRLVCDGQRCEMPYDYMDGTSMASPVVAGGLALIRSAMYQDYYRVAQRHLMRRELRGNRILNFREFFHEQADMAKWQLQMAVTPSQLAERLLFSYTNNPGRRIPEGLIYEGRRDPIFGYGRVDLGGAVEAASKVFTVAGL